MHPGVLVAGWLSVVAALAAAVARRMSRQNARARSDWLRESMSVAVRELGLQVAGPPEGSVAHASLGEFSIRAELRTEAVQRGAEIAVAAASALLGVPQDIEYVEVLMVNLIGGRIPAGIAFTTEYGGGDDVLVGDPLFDETVHVSGEPAVVLALLDEGTRGRIRDVVAAGGRLAHGELVHKAPGPFLTTEITLVVRRLLGLAGELSATARGGIPQRLARNATGDRQSGVRLWNLLALQEGFGQTTEAAEASRQALADSSPWVRLSAGRFLGAEALEVLQVLAQDPAAPDQAAAEAVGVVAHVMPGDAAGAWLTEYLDHSSGPARRQAIEELGRLAYRPALSRLTVLLGRSDLRVAQAAADALGSLGDVQAERPLLRAAASDDAGLRVAALRALGRAGSARAVEPLLRLLAERKMDGPSRHALQAAVRSIQSRLVGAEAGQLTIAGDDVDGRLSLATDLAGEGAVSFSDDAVKAPR